MVFIDQRPRKSPKTGLHRIGWIRTFSKLISCVRTTIVSRSIHLERPARFVAETIVWLHVAQVHIYIYIHLAMRLSLVFSVYNRTCHTRYLCASTRVLTAPDHLLLLLTCLRTCNAGAKG